jgi:hypothetical protein
MLRVRWITLFIVVILSVGTLSRAAAQEPPCEEMLTCTPTPAPPPDVPVGPPWSGYTDGRLNPDPAEYYSVWCQDGVVRVLRAVPNTALVRDIPISDLQALRDGFTREYRDAGDLKVTKQGDIIMISGSNLSPASGSKAFSLSVCIALNGGLPTPMPTNTPAPTAVPEVINCGVGLFYDLTSQSCRRITFDVMTSICQPLFGIVLAPGLLVALRRRLRGKRGSTRL